MISLCLIIFLKSYQKVSYSDIECVEVSIHVKSEFYKGNVWLNYNITYPEWQEEIIRFSTLQKNTLLLSWGQHLAIDKNFLIQSFLSNLFLHSAILAMAPNPSISHINCQLLLPFTFSNIFIIFQIYQSSSHIWWFHHFFSPRRFLAWFC